MPTHQEVQMVSCTVFREVKGRAKVEVSTASTTTVKSQVTRPNSVMQRMEKERERERRETAKVGMTAKVGQSERDGQTKVGTLQAKIRSNKGQQELKQDLLCYMQLDPTFLLRHDLCWDLCIAGIVVLGVVGLEDRVE